MPLIPGPYGFMVDPEAGLVIGPRGKPVGSPNTRGYLQADLRRRGGGLPFIHRIVWQAVHGPLPPGREINHINGDKADNRIVNLELTTRSGNMKHAYRTGLKSNVGTTGAPRSLSPAEVRSLRHLYGLPVAPSLAWLSSEYGVSRSTITRALRDDKYLRPRHGHDIEVEVVD